MVIESLEIPVLATHTLRRATAEPRWNMDRCSECIEPWRGDADTGGCTARLLALEVQRLRAQWDRLQRGLARPYVAGAAWPVGEE